MITADGGGFDSSYKPPKTRKQRKSRGRLSLEERRKKRAERKAKSDAPKKAPKKTTTGPKARRTRSTRYSTYIKSERWAERRKLFLAGRPYRCEICGSSKRGLHVHHLHYQHLEKEPDNDLQLLCAACHKREHKLRPRNSLSSARALKKYIKTITREDAIKRFGPFWAGEKPEEPPTK